MKDEKTPAKKDEANEIAILFQSSKNPLSSAIETMLFVCGVLFTPIALLGMLWGYVRAYIRFMFPKRLKPTFENLPKIVPTSMGIFMMIAVLLATAVFVFLNIFIDDVVSVLLGGWLGYYLIGNLVLCLFVFFGFKKWQNKINAVLHGIDSHGDADFAVDEDVKEYQTGKGIYLGAMKLGYEKQAHFLSSGITRSGKFTTLIAPALLNLTNALCSWFIIDPKGEAAAVTARRQQEIGNRVIIMDAWGISDFISSKFNPLDLIRDIHSRYFSDDALLIADMICPIDPNEHQKFFPERARAFIAGALMHLMISEERKTLGRLWELLSGDDEEFKALLDAMHLSKNAVVRKTSHDLQAVMKAELTYGAIISNVQNAIEFLNSECLRDSLEDSDFDINTLSDGKTTIYAIIPIDQIDTHPQYARILTSTAIVAVTRNKNQKVTFLLDEFASLRKMDNIFTGLNYLATFNITLWMIVQNYVQLKNLYGDGWENFISACSVRHVLGVDENFTADYLSHALGQRTVFAWDADTGQGAIHHARPLMNPTEIIRASDKKMLIFIDRKPPLLMERLDYYKMPELVEEADPNPYVTPKESDFLLNKYLKQQRAKGEFNWNEKDWQFFLDDQGLNRD
jgi:type IV secretion system protein VirD4